MGKKDKKDQVTCEIKTIHGYLSDKKDKVLVDVSWNNGPVRTEIRRCWTDKNGELRLGAGVPLDDNEIESLYGIHKKRPKPVDFDEVFRSSLGIMEKRSAGFRTVDGFIELRKRG